MHFIYLVIMLFPVKITYITASRNKRAVAGGRLGLGGYVTTNSECPKIERATRLALEPANWAGHSSRPY